MQDSDTEEEFIAQLVAADAYKHHRGQVANITTKSIRVVKRKVFSREGHEIAFYPFSDCTQVEHKDERSILVTIFGLLLFILIACIVYLVAIEWEDLDPGTSVPVGALFFGGLYGLKWALGSRRHKLVFKMKDGANLIWKSRNGDFRYRTAVVQNLLEFAGEEGLRSSVPVTYLRKRKGTD
jgi:hypothetical protein